jgi:hypothetical protein
MGPRNARPNRYARPGVPAGAALVLDQAEAELQSNSDELAEALHLLMYHVRRADLALCEAGFTDRVYAGPGGTIFVEFKRTGEKPRANQQEWIDTLREGGETVHVWEPKHWLDGTIARELNRIARRSTRRPR